MDNSRRGMNPVAMTIIDPRKEYWPSRGSNQRPPLSYWLRLQALQNELQWSAVKKLKYSLTSILAPKPATYSLQNCTWFGASVKQSDPSPVRTEIAGSVILHLYSINLLTLYSVASLSIGDTLNRKSNR